MVNKSNNGGGSKFEMPQVPGCRHQGDGNLLFNIPINLFDHLF